MENPEDSFNLSNQILNRERTVEEVADRAMYEDTDAKDAILAYEKKMEHIDERIAKLTTLQSLNKELSGLIHQKQEAMHDISRSDPGITATTEARIEMLTNFIHQFEEVSGISKEEADDTQNAIEILRSDLDDLSDLVYKAQMNSRDN
jgi:hypothetical protein